MTPSEANRLLCNECIAEPHLRRRVEETGRVSTCDYCGQEGLTLLVAEIANMVDTAFSQHYEQTSDQPSDHEYAMTKVGFGWDREGDPSAIAIADAAGISETAAEDIRVVLEHRYFDFEMAQMLEEGQFEREAHYSLKAPDASEYVESWLRFENGLKKKARYFSTTASETLDQVFEDLENHLTSDGHSVIIEAGPANATSSLFRARAFQSDAELNEALAQPELHLGPPPAPVARAGRLNSHGISVFYGATDASVAISEVRPPVGSKVIVGEFELIRPVRLLDVSALRSVYIKGSMFDPKYAGRLGRAKFLEHLSERVSRPIMPDDELLEYLVTQVIADYLSSKPSPYLDGFMYPSVQAGGIGMNVMLFHRTSRVEPTSVQAGIEIHVFGDMGPDSPLGRGYTVYETERLSIPDGNSRISFPLPVDTSLFSVNRESDDHREPTLHLNPGSLTVHHVCTATYGTNSYPVTRNRA